MKKKAIFLLGIGLLFLASCATKYVPMSDSIFSDHTGYAETPIDSSTYEVTFTGNQQTSAEVVGRYAIYRAAEITVDKGFDYFIVIDRDNSSATVVTTGPPMTSTGAPQTDLVAHTTTTTTTTTQTVQVGTMHTSTKTIRMFKGQRPADNAQAYDAKSMVAMMAPSINR